MNQPAKAQEPTMEEILASIRRIIADDDTVIGLAREVEATGGYAARQLAEMLDPARERNE